MQHLAFEIAGHEFLIFGISAQFFVFFHTDVMLGQMAGSQGRTFLAAKAALETASKDEALAKRAENDIEFATIR